MEELQIFNIADSAIFFGVILIFLNAFMEWMKEKKVKKEKHKLELV